MAHTKKRLLNDQITEMWRKIRALEEDNDAFYERSRSNIQTNREFNLQLRQENKELRKKAADENANHENMMKGALCNRGLEKDAGQAAVATREHKVMVAKDQLNAVKHMNQTLHRRLEELKEEYQREKAAGSRARRSADAHSREKEEEAMKLRSLETSVEKMQSNCSKAEKITRIYEKVQSHLQEENLTFPGRLDGLEAELLKQREELVKMHDVNNSAQLAKEATMIDLQQQEELFYKERKEREHIIASYRQRAAECRAQVEKAQSERATLQPDELSTETQHSVPMVEEEKDIFTYEEAFQRIKEATGVTDVEDIVQCFASQKEKQQHLEKLKAKNEELLEQLNEQMQLLSQQLQSMKYSGDAKLSSDEHMVEKSEQRLQDEQKRSDAAKEHLEHLVKTLSNIRGGIEHLSDKLQHIMLSPEDTVTDVSPDSDEYAVVLMTQCKMKLKALHEELQGKDVAAVLKKMKEDEFLVKFEGKLPAWNTRVKFSEDQSLDDEQDDSDEDEAGVITREALKAQSQRIIDANTKKPWER